MDKYHIYFFIGLVVWGDCLKEYVVVLFQFMIWSAYTFIEFIAVHDRIISKILMFLIFTYLSIYIAKTILKSGKQVFLITIISLTSFALLRLLFDAIYSIYS